MTAVTTAVNNRRRGPARRPEAPPSGYASAMNALPERRPSRLRDEVDGNRPAMLLALGIGIIVGGVVAGIFVAGSYAVSALGGVGPGVAGLTTAVLIWFALWVSVSLGVGAGLAVAMRVWLALAPVAVRHTEAAERRAAVAEVESLLDEAGTARPERD